MDETTNRPTAPTPLADDDPRALLTRAVGLADTVMAATPPDALAAPSPSGMNVRDLQEHMVMVLRRVACAGRAVPPTDWPVDAADVADDGFLDAWRAAADEVQVAWSDDALLDRPTDLPWGTFSGVEVMGTYTDEITVHTWDLAEATDQRPRWDDDVLAFADAAIHAQLPVAERGPMWDAIKDELPPGIEWERPFGDAVEVAADAPLIDRLVAWNGRRP